MKVQGQSCRGSMVHGCKDVKGDNFKEDKSEMGK